MKRVKYTINLRDKESGMAMGYKKGKIMIKDRDNIDSVMSKIKDRHKIDDKKTVVECRLHKFTFKPQS